MISIHLSNLKFAIEVLSKLKIKIKTSAILQVVNSFKGLKYRKEIISDKKDSTLRNIANKYSIDVLDHDETIGGRFSCFSLTGLLPMYLAGINSIKLKKLVDKSFKKYLLSKNNVNSIFITVVSQIIRKKESKGKVNVPFSKIHECQIAFVIYHDEYNDGE